MREKKFQSIVRRVVLFPLLVLVIIMFITVLSCIASYWNMQQKMVDSNINSLQISMNQLENVLSGVDSAFVQYWNTDTSYAQLKSMKPETPREQYLTYEADTGNWLSNLFGMFREVEGAFAYYKNLDLLLFRGGSNFEMHDYIKKQMESQEASYNRWQIVEISGTQYIINLKSYGEFCGGVWMPVELVFRNLGMENMNFLGNVYLVDEKYENTLKDNELREIIRVKGPYQEKLYTTGEGYACFTVQGSDVTGVRLGILIPQKNVIFYMPLYHKVIFLLAFFSLFLVPGVILWLQRKIARPVRDIDEAMRLIGEGDVEYRIPLPEKNFYDEFDRLIVRFNQMMDELNELEFNLYRTKIKEQRTELKYISQQIRPHFILNALNIIYTYDETEFPLVKKMVLYLTDYFRYIVNLKVDFVAVEQELRHVENYLKIQKERYLDRFEFFVEWESRVKDYLLPPLIIQTFVENCIKYGMKDEGKTFIYVLASQEEGRLRLMVADTGRGFSNEVLHKIEVFLNTRTYQEDLGVGIQNAVERMDILYDEKTELKVHNALSGGAVVEIFLPAGVQERGETDVQCNIGR